MIKNIKLVLLVLGVLVWTACAPAIEEPSEPIQAVESELQEPALKAVDNESEGQETMSDETIKPVSAKQNDADAEGSSAEQAIAVAVPTAIQSLVATMQADAAERSGVSADKLITTAADPVTWNDGSLGCPEPDMMYTMAIVEGYKVVISADGKAYEYHTDGNDYFVYCANPEK